MREVQNRLHTFSKSCRITPARAGRTSADLEWNFPHRDHPRSRGKDFRRPRVEFPTSGSPPLAREGPNLQSRASGNFRITPACAERICNLKSEILVSKDHPRVCGKDISTPKLKCPEPGSPPRVREGHHPFKIAYCFVRITPECAGRTLSDDVYDRQV